MLAHDSLVETMVVCNEYNMPADDSLLATQINWYAIWQNKMENTRVGNENILFYSKWDKYCLNWILKLLKEYSG